MFSRHGCNLKYNYLLCVSSEKGSRREIKGGMAVLTSIPASNGAELAKALDNVMRQSDELRPLAGKTKTYLSQPELEFLAKNRQQSKSF